MLPIKIRQSENQTRVQVQFGFIQKNDRIRWRDIPKPEIPIDQFLFSGTKVIDIVFTPTSQFYRKCQFAFRAWPWSAEFLTRQEQREEFVHGLQNRRSTGVGTACLFHKKVSYVGRGQFIFNVGVLALPIEK